MDSTTVRNELITAARFRLQRFRDLVALAEDQRAILMERRHADLPENLRKHDSLLLDLAKVEKREESLLGMLSGDDGEGRSPGVGDTSDFEDRYAEINRETRDIALRLQTLVACNTKMLNTMMEYVQFSVSVMSRLMGEQQSYDPAADPGSGALLLDRKV